MDRLIAQYGLALVFANVLLEQLGLPIPAVPALVVAGALSAEGELSPLAAFGVAFVACMMGDAAREVPGRVAHHARDERDAEHRERRELPLGRERTGDDERRDRRNRQPELLEQHVRENQREPVVGDQAIHAFALSRP